MPWIESVDANTPSYYKEPQVYAYDDLSIDYLIEKKKQHSRDRDEFLNYQKQCGKDDREFAKYFRNEAAEEMKAYRGSCYALSILACTPPGDCKNLQASKELSPYIDQAFASGDLEWCKRNLKHD